jgi:hypothetical protein
MRFRAWLVVPLALALAAPAAAQDGAIAGVERSEHARFDAQVRRDTSALRRLLGADLTYIHSNGLVETRDHFIETVALRRIVYDSLVPVEMRRRVFGETVVGDGKVRVQVQMSGQTIRVDLLVTTVHVRRDGRWQLVAWQSTRAQ